MAAAAAAADDDGGDDDDDALLLFSWLASLLNRALIFEVQSLDAAKQTRRGFAGPEFGFARLAPRTFLSQT